MRTSGRIARAAKFAVAAAVITTTALAGTMSSAMAASTSPAAKVSAAANLPHSAYQGSIHYMAPGLSSKGVTPHVTGDGSNISATSSVTICPQDCGQLAQTFNTDYTASGGFTSCFQNMNGSAYASWGGNAPFNADRMTLNNNIWVAGVGVSISIATSIGAGVSISNNTVYFSESQNNTWQLSHSFTNLAFCTKLWMTGPYENSRDSATFGTHTYTDFIN